MGHEEIRDLAMHMSETGLITKWRNVALKEIKNRAMLPQVIITEIIYCYYILLFHNLYAGI